MVAVGDRPFDPDGYWPADVAMFTTLPGFERIDLLATDGVLEAGYLDRLRLAFVEIEEIHRRRPRRASAGAGGAASYGDDGALIFDYRDREDELEAVARRVKADRIAAGGPPFDSIGLVVARPLPYLYLAREVFDGAGFPSKRSTPCRWPPSRMPPRLTWCSNARPPTSPGGR